MLYSVIRLNELFKREYEYKNAADHLNRKGCDDGDRTHVNFIIFALETVHDQADEENQGGQPGENYCYTSQYQAPHIG